MILMRRAERIFERLEPAGGDDTRRVMDAARALDIKEFDLFRLAWRHWHGDDSRPETIERAFGQYMLHDRVPPWALDRLQHQRNPHRHRDLRAARAGAPAGHDPGLSVLHERGPRV